jgi:hypothetical protein
MAQSPCPRCDIGNGWVHMSVTRDTTVPDRSRVVVVVVRGTVALALVAHSTSTLLAVGSMASRVQAVYFLMLCHGNEKKN